MLVGNELDQFDGLTFGEVFHRMVMFRIEVRGPSLGIGKKTTGSSWISSLVLPHQQGLLQRKFVLG